MSYLERQAEVTKSSANGDERTKGDFWIPNTNSSFLQMLRSGLDAFLLDRGEVPDRWRLAGFQQMVFHPQNEASRRKYGLPSGDCMSKIKVFVVPRKQAAPPLKSEQSINYFLHFFYNLVPLCQ